MELAELRAEAYGVNATLNFVAKRAGCPRRRSVPDLPPTTSSASPRTERRQP